MKQDVRMESCPNHSHLKNILTLCYASLIALATPLYAGYECTYDEVTVDPTDPYLTCVTTCQTQLHWVPPNNMLSCNFLHQQNWCMRYCADAEEDVCEGNPIQLSSGAKLQAEIDYQGNGEYPLVLSRNYSSAWTMPDGHWGEHWLGTGSSRIVSVNTDNEGDVYTAVRPNGSYLKFAWISGGGGATRPVKTDTNASLTLYNYQDGYIWVLRLPDGTHEVYDFDMQAFIADQRYTSRLLWTKWRGGLRHTYAYDTEGRVETITHTNGRQLQFVYDSQGRVEQVIAPEEQVFSYQYDLLGNLASVTYPGPASEEAGDTATKTYLYEDARHPYHLTGIVDEHGQQFAHYAYDEEGRAVLSEHGEGAERVEVLQYGDNVRTRNALGKETIYHFGTAGSGAGTIRQLLSVDGEASASCAASNSSTSYDANGFRDLLKDANDHYTDFDYDDRGQLIRRTEPLVMVDGNLEPLPETRIVETDWIGSPALNLPVEQREPGKTTRYTYQNDRVITRTETDTAEQTVPYGTQGNTRIWTYSYTFYDSEQSQIETLALDGPLPGAEDTRRYTFDLMGNLIRYVNPLGQSIDYSNHTPQGQPGRIVDANGLVTDMSYNAVGLLTEARVFSQQGTVVTGFAYHPNRLISRITLDDGSYLSFDYNTAHHLTAIANDRGERIEYSPNLLDGAWAEEIVRSGSGAIVRTKQRVFDELGRLVRLLGANSQQTDYHYDLVGNPVGLIEQGDGFQAETLSSYDGLNRLTELTDPLEHLIRLGYDRQGNLNEVTDQLGRQTRYVYDGFGNLIQQISPDTGTTTYTYDEAGNPRDKTDARNITSTYAYDLLNRLTDVHYPDSRLDRAYRYDQGINGIGHLTRMSDAEGMTDFAYNDVGSLIRQTRTSQDGVVTTFEYAYDAQGRIASQTYPSGNRLEFSYAQGQLSELILQRPDGSRQSLAGNLDYLPFGSVQSLAYGNGLVLTRSYDQDYRMTGQTIPGVLESRYSYDPMNNITGWEDLLNTSLSRHFQYDALNRLIVAERDPYNGTSYVYDALGNRESTMTWTIRGFSSSTTDLPDYDEAGNAIQGPMERYGYDDTNRMVDLTKGTTHANYGYNGKGERVRKTVNGETTRFRYGPSGELLGEYNQAGELIREYVYLRGQPIAQIQPNHEPAVIDFTQTTVLSYGGGTSQDVMGTVEVNESGVTMAGNTWKKIAFPYTVTPNTVLEFDFQSAQQGELHGIGFDTDDAISPDRSFIVYGTQSWGIRSEGRYNGSGQQHFVIPVGNYFTGTMQWLTLTNDHDVANPTGESQFRNVRVYESGAEMAGGASTLVYLHTDHLGAVVKATDQYQDIVWDAVREPFGRRFVTVNQIEMPLGFPGQYYDQESGNFYNYFRDYDPSTGRYLQSDPIGLLGGINTYAYVAGNPLFYADPYGLSKLTIGYNDGTSVSIDNPSAQDFVNTINNSPNNSITNVQQMGHGNTSSICISAGTGCSGYIYNDGGIYGNDGYLGNLQDILKDKLAEESEINLEGCNNASGDDNITKRLSEMFPGVNVTGGNGYQFGYENHWLFGNSSSSWGFKRTYRNGVAK